MPRKHDIHTEDVILRKRSENRAYYDNDGVRDSIVMSDLTGGFSSVLSKWIVLGCVCGCVSMLQLKGSVPCLK